jgi:UDP-N-acetyl-D-mannosaminuronic acid dehydrogenase
LLEKMKKHLAPGLKVYDPFVKKELVENQYYDFDKFLFDVDLVVIMVSHDEIKEQMDKLEGKVVLDTRNICQIEGTYKL